MDILVFGAGAVGGYLGAHLAHANHNVTLIVRGAAAEAIQRNGLSVGGGGQVITARPPVVTSLRQAVAGDASYDLLLLAVKSYDAKAALDELAAFYPSPPPIITLQNGVGIEEIFLEEFGPERTIAGSLTTPLSNETYHSIVVEHAGRGLALAPTAKKQDISQWAQLFQDSGIEATEISDYRSMKWSKMLVNMIGNASSAILNRHPKLVYSYGPTFKLEMDMLQETLAVMKKMKIKPVDLPGVSVGRLVFAVKRLPDSVVRPILTQIVGSGRGNKMPSFHIDLMAGKEVNEVSYHNGAVAEAGLELGVPTPVNAALTDILLMLARKEIDYQVYNGQPKSLVAEVQKYRKAAAGKR
jgi:2-dehydropantoate 2-reductase